MQESDEERMEESMLSGGRVHMKLLLKASCGRREGG